MNFWLQIIGFGLAAYVIFVKLLKPLAKTIPSIVIKFTMSRIHKQVLNLKTKLFEEAFEKIETNNNTGKLEILELGVGSGENFRSFPKNSNITVLDVTDRFLPALQESIEQNRKDLTISKLVVSSAEKMTPIESNSMDAVVHTFMLCSIPDTAATLNEIYRVLK
jgi:ubiquinone/menaquinone biosynthesis C-methylase UbiE